MLPHGKQTAFMRIITIQSWINKFGSASSDYNEIQSKISCFKETNIEEIIRNCLQQTKEFQTRALNGYIVLHPRYIQVNCYN